MLGEAAELLSGSLTETLGSDKIQREQTSEKIGAEFLCQHLCANFVNGCGAGFEPATFGL